MAEFVAITTQEDFDKAIASRLERERNTVRKQYEDYDKLKADITDLQGKLSAANTTIAEKDTQITDLNGKIKGYETDSAKTRILIEAGLPLEMKSRLQGVTEEEIKADAAELVKLIAPKPTTQRLYNPEPTTNKDAAWVELSQNLFNK